MHVCMCACAAFIDDGGVFINDGGVGTKYVQVGTGQFASYLLRSDGVVARTIRGGHVSSFMTPPGQ